MYKMYFKLLILNYFILKVNAEIPNSLHNYIKLNNHLEKYSITLLLEYEKNSTERFLEEKLFLRRESVDLKNMKLLNKEVSVALCENEHENYQNRKSFRVAVLESLQNILQFRIKYNTMNEETDFFDENYLANNSFDLVLCSNNINGSLFNVLHSTFKNSYVIVYKGDNIAINQDIFVLTFAGTLWLCFVLIVLLLAICLNVSTIKYSKIYGQPSWGTVDITFWGIAAAGQQGLSTTPTGFASRLIFFLGYLTSYLLYTGFAAAITSLLAVQNENYMLTFSDIEAMNLNIISFGYIQNLPSQYDYLINGRPFKTLHSFLYHLNNDKSIGVTEKNTLENYFISEDKMFEYCDFIISELKHTGYPISFYVPKKSPYKNIFNYWLLRLDQTGILNLTAEHTKPKLPVCESPPGYSSATLEHVASAIMLLLTGLVISLIFLVIECLWNGYKHRTIKRY